MRSATLALLAAGLLTSTAEVRDHDGHAARLVHGWYHQYLHRHPDAHGLAGHVWALEHGTPAELVEARIIASPEYYARHGHNDHTFVVSLLADLGGSGHPGHVRYYVSRLHQLGCRETFAREMLHRFRSPAPVAVPAPVVETYRPAYPVYTAPVVATPVYRAPVYAAPAYPVRSTWFEGSYSRPGFSIGLGISR